METESVAEADTDLFGCLDSLIFRRNHFQLAGTLFKRNSLDLAIHNADHDAIFSVEDCFCSTCSNSCGKHTVVCTWCASTLGVSRNCDSDFRTKLLSDFISNFVRYGRVLLRRR